MSKGTAPAWQVRNLQRQKLLKEIQQLVTDKEDEFEHPTEMHSLWLALALGGALDVSCVGKFSQEEQETIGQLLLDIAEKITSFQRSKIEGRALMGMMLEWGIFRLTNQYAGSLQNEEFENPKLIFGTDRATDDVPIPA